MTLTSAPLTTVLARDAMHQPIIACGPETLLQDVAALMAQHRVHCVVVHGVRHEASGDDLVWAVVSDLDLVRAAVTAPDADATAATIAATPALTVDETATLAEVGRTIADNDCSHAVVLREGLPVGVISTLDIASAVARP